MQQYASRESFTVTTHVNCQAYGPIQHSVTRAPCAYPPASIAYMAFRLQTALEAASVTTYYYCIIEEPTNASSNFSSPDTSSTLQLRRTRLSPLFRSRSMNSLERIMALVAQQVQSVSTTTLVSRTHLHLLLLPPSRR